MVLSMVFGCCGLFLLELCSLLERKPCLANTLPEVYKGLHKPPPKAASVLSMVFFFCWVKPPGANSP